MRNPTNMTRNEPGYTIYTRTGSRNKISVAYNPRLGNACYISWDPDRTVLAKTKTELRKLTDRVARVTRQESFDERCGVEGAIRWQTDIRDFMKRTD